MIEIKIICDKCKKETNCKRYEYRVPLRSNPRLLKTKHIDLCAFCGLDLRIASNLAIAKQIGENTTIWDWSEDESEGIASVVNERFKEKNK